MIDICLLTGTGQVTASLGNVLVSLSCDEDVLRICR